MYFVLPVCFCLSLVCLLFAGCRTSTLHFLYSLLLHLLCSSFLSLLIYSVFSFYLLSYLTGYISVPPVIEIAYSCTSVTHRHSHRHYHRHYHRHSSIGRRLSRHLTIYLTLSRRLSSAVSYCLIVLAQISIDYRDLEVFVSSIVSIIVSISVFVSSRLVSRPFRLRFHSRSLHIVTRVLTPHSRLTRYARRVSALTHSSLRSSLVSRFAPMCEFTQREYSCGHFRFIAARWCNLYKISHRRCHPDVTHFEFRQHEICGICQPYEMPAWFHAVKAAAAPPTPPSPKTVTSKMCVQKRRKSSTTRPPIPLFSSTLTRAG